MFTVISSVIESRKKVGQACSIRLDMNLLRKIASWNLNGNSR
jgi:hypothetical protein